MLAVAPPPGVSASRLCLVNTMRSAVSPACTRFTRMAAIAGLMLSLFPVAQARISAPIPQALIGTPIVLEDFNLSRGSNACLHGQKDCDSRKAANGPAQARLPCYDGHYDAHFRVTFNRGLGGRRMKPYG